MSARTDRATVVSWASWDWGSAAFNAVMVTFIYSVYLVESVGEDLPGDTPTSTWFSAAMAVAGVVIAVLAPVQGRRADAKGARRKSLIAWTLVTIALMVGQFFVRDDASWFWPGVIMLAVAAVTFEFAEVSYFAQLRQVSTPDNVGRVSGFGWSAGYFGGIFLLLICYFGFISGEGGTLGLPTDDGMNIRLVALLSAGWFLIFALPAFLRVPEIPAQPNEDSGYAQSYRRLFSEIRELWHADRRTIKFLVAQAIFRDGLAGVFSFGAILAVTVYGLSAADVLLFGVAANVVAALGSLAAGFIDDRFGPRPVIMWSLGLMVVTSIALLFVAVPVRRPRPGGVAILPGPRRPGGPRGPDVRPLHHHRTCGQLDVPGRIRHLHLGVRHRPGRHRRYRAGAGHRHDRLRVRAPRARPPQGRGRADPRELAAHAGIPPGSLGPAGTRARPGTSSPA